MAQPADYEETFKRLSHYEGVQGVIVINSDGVSIRTSLDNDRTVQYASLITPLIARTRNYLREIDFHNEFTFLRLVTKLHEIMVAPDKDYSLIVIQEPFHFRYKPPPPNQNAGAAGKEVVVAEVEGEK